MIAAEARKVVLARVVDRFLILNDDPVAHEQVQQGMTLHYDAHCDRDLADQLGV